MPMITPGQGRSEFTGSLNKWKASARGMPQVELGTRMEGMAFSYPSIRPYQPPTSIKPQRGDKRVRQTGTQSNGGGKMFSHIDSLKAMRVNAPTSMIAV